MPKRHESVFVKESDHDITLDAKLNTKIKTKINFAHLLTENKISSTLSSSFTKSRIRVVSNIIFSYSESL